jgi:hypothetical protein
MRPAPPNVRRRPLLNRADDFGPASFATLYACRLADIPPVHQPSTEYPTSGRAPLAVGAQNGASRISVPSPGLTKFRSYPNVPGAQPPVPPPPSDRSTSHQKGLVRGFLAAGFHSALRYLIPRCETSQGFCGSGALLPAAWGRFAAGGRPRLSKRNSIGNRGSNSSARAGSTGPRDNTPGRVDSSRTDNNPGYSSRGSRARTQARRLRAQARRRHQG